MGVFRFGISVFPYFAFLLYAAFVAPALAEIPLSGEQDGLLETNDYLVTGLIKVKRGKTLSFAPGSYVRFNQYGGIVVEGTLKCAGTQHAPIVFTSRNQRPSGFNGKDIPAPFDWNGILAVDSLSSIDIENVHVDYSTFGLDIRSLLANIRLKRVVFDGNGKSNVVVAGKELDVKDKEPFSYSQWLPLDDPPPAPAVVEPPVSPPARQEPVIPPQRHYEQPPQKNGWKLPVGLGCGALAVGGTVLAFYFDGKVDDYQKKFENEHSDGNAVNSAARSRDKAVVGRDVSKLVAIVGACGFAVTFLF